MSNDRSSYYKVVGALLQRGAYYKSKAELARLVGVSRQRIHQLIKKAVASGTLREDPFGYRPQMIRHTNSVSQPTNLVITEVVA